MEFMCIPYAAFLICLCTKTSLSRISLRDAILSQRWRKPLTSVNTKSIGRPLTSDRLPRHSAIRRLASNGNTYLTARGVDATYILSTSVFIFNQVANPHPGLSLGWLSWIFLLHERKSSAAVNNDRLLSIPSQNFKFS